MNITGTGGNGSSSNNNGVFVSLTSIVSSTDGGDINITGYGTGRSSASDTNAALSTSANSGVFISGGSIIKTIGANGGNLTINGYGGNGLSSSNSIILSKASPPSSTNQINENSSYRSTTSESQDSTNFNTKNNKIKNVITIARKPTQIQL